MTPEKKLRICMVSDDFLPAATGVGTHLQLVSALLVSRGHRVLVLTTRRPGEAAFEVWNGVEVHRVPTFKVFGFYQGVPSLQTISTLFKNFAPDIVHFHYLSVMMLRALKAADRLDLPKVYTYHMTEDHLTQPLLMRPFRASIAKYIVRLCNQADLVISVSRTLAAQLPGRGIRTPIRYISNPVSFPPSEGVLAIRSGASFTIMFAGRLNPEKNLPFLIRGFAKLLELQPDSVLWIAGMGSQKPRLERICRRLGVHGRVKFLGFLEHETLSRYYAGCDVFVLPSLVETQGLVAMEAMWFSKPLIVARSVVSAEELVDQDLNGFIVDQGDEAALAERLARLSSDAELRRNMGCEGKAKTRAFMPQSVVEDLDKAYRDTLKDCHGSLLTRHDNT